MTDFLYLGEKELNIHALFKIVGQPISFLNQLERRFKNPADKVGGL